MIQSLFWIGGGEEECVGGFVYKAYGKVKVRDKEKERGRKKREERGG